MTDNSTLKRIWANSRQETPSLVLLTVGNAFYSVCGVSSAVFAKLIIDSAQRADGDALIKYALIFLCVLVLQIALLLLCKALEVRISGRLEIKYKTELFSRILKNDYLKISSYHSGELLTRLTSDVGVVSSAVTSIVPQAVSLVTRLLCAFAVLFYLDRRFALVLMAAGAALFVFVKIFRGSMKKLHRRVQETDGKVRSFMQETIESLLVVKIFGAADKMREKSLVLQEDNYDAKIRKNRWSIFANMGFSAAFSFGYLFALVWSGLRLCAGSITFGTLTATVQLIGQVQSPLTNLSAVVPQYYSALASAERIFEVEDLGSGALLNKEEIDVKRVYEQLQSIEFDDVSFSYGREPVLKNASFKIEKGDFVVISGISGIGKSTLFKLLTGVLPPNEGQIRINSGGKSFFSDKYTRPLFAYVPQGNMLFSGTVRDNIRFINEDATDDEIMKAAEVCCADGFINDLPDGLDTVLLEGGHGLSEGQIQRLAVARAVVTGAPVLLLDEATSALDEQTEKKLLSNIKQLSDKTCVIISHKSAAYEICGKEISIKEGCVSLEKIK